MTRSESPGWNVKSLTRASDFHADPGVSEEQQAILRRFLAISGDPDSASLQLRRLATDNRCAGAYARPMDTSRALGPVNAPE